MDEEAQIEGNQFRGPNRIQFPPQSTTPAISISVSVKDRPPVSFKVPDLKAAGHIHIVVPKGSHTSRIRGQLPFPRVQNRIFGEIVDENGQPLSRSDIIKVVIHSSRSTRKWKWRLVE